MKPQIYTIQEAERLGYRSITTAYDERDETEMKYLANVLSDMIGIDHCIIKNNRWIEVGRVKNEVL